MLVLAALLLGLLAHTLHASHPERHQCEENFYKHTLPRHIVHSGLEKWCHGPAGRSYTSLYHTECQASVYTAFHLSHSNGWGKGTSEKDETWNGEDSSVFIPSLYKRNREILPTSDSLSPLQKVDTLTAELVESQIIPLCSKGGGEVYVQSGVGALNRCEAGLLWTAVCCSAPDGAASFSMGMVLEGGDDVKVVSVEELEKLVGIGELFLGGCGQGVKSREEMMSISKEGMENVQGTGGKEAEVTDETKIYRDSRLESLNNEVKEEVSSYKTQKSETSSDPLKQEPETSSKSLNQEPETSSKSLNQEPETSSKPLNQASETSSIEETSIEQSLSEKSTFTNDTEPSESVLLYILSSSFSLLYAPLSPIVSTLTNLPSQITYVLQEDAAVLTALPGDTLTLGRDIVCGVASGVENVWDVLYQVVETGVGSTYFCLKTLTGTLLMSCQEGVTGTGTLVSDALGLATGTTGQVLGTGSSLVGSAGCGLVGYLGTLGWEMGHQVKKAGRGIGVLLWRSQKGLGHLLRTAGAVAKGVLDNAVENVQEAFEGTENVDEAVQEASAGAESVVETVQEVSSVVENAGQSVEEKVQQEGATKK
ncbi:hypothetical protein AMEX_G8067 [Astyanax mexicanus]|uniref:INO80 complex subunit E n=1 Tax=Astyanax mexicanus TaxID=7994 RepID=A0A8B9H9I1_ASTMX|nr:hypothetical protein AMEX_G8067 [Astyanax mexicanus]